MFSIGLFLFVICFLLGVHNASKGFKGNKTVSSVTGYGVMIGFWLMVSSIIVFLWKVLP